ncbi:MAG TPA: hypothetical protein VF635_18125, partial [Propionibacteriaceae bacterium]
PSCARLKMWPMWATEMATELAAPRSLPGQGLHRAACAEVHTLVPGPDLVAWVPAIDTVN